MGTGYPEHHPRGRRGHEASPRGAHLSGDHEVVCIGYELVDDRYERIATLGIRRGRKIYVLSSADIAGEVALGSRFHVTRTGQTSYLRVGISSSGRPFVQTIPDATGVNNLSLLPDCAALERIDRQARAVQPMWWWLIPSTLLALTAFFVIAHIQPVNVKWNPAAAITYPTPLGADQLSATANIPGDFIYDPPLGTVLHAAGQQALRVTFHTEPLPSPWRELAILSGSLALAAAVVLAFRAWRGWFVDRRLRREEAEEERELATAPAAVRRRVQRVEERLGDRDEFPARRSNPWWPAAGLALVTLPLAGLLGYYVAHPRTVVAQQNIDVLPGSTSLTWSNPAGGVYPFTLSESQLNAVATVPGKIVYDPPINTRLNAGAGQLLRASFTPDSADYVGTTMTVTINVAKGQPDLSWDNVPPVAFGTPLGPVQLNARSSVPGRFTYVPAAGDVLQVGTHNLVATFHPQDSSNWNEGTVGVQLAIGKIPLVLTWPQPAPLTYPTPLSDTQYNYRILPAQAGTVVVTPTIGTVPNAGEQQLVLTFKPDDGANFDSVSGSANLTVLPGDPGPKWSNPADIVVGTPLGPEQLNATANVPGKFIYTPPAGTVLEVGDSQPLTVKFEPDNQNYAEASGAVSIKVKDKDDPPNPPVLPHQAQFLRNGDFEGGFTVAAPATAVGTHWRHFNNGNYHYGYYDDQWDKVWYSANHSQLIELGAATYDPGDRPNRLSGISQTVRGLIPGQRYSLTLHGIIRVNEDDPNTDNLSYVAQWGMAAGASATWGNVKTWNVVPWTHVFPYLTGGPVQSYTTTFTAQSETLTLFIGLLKNPGKGNTELNLNVDGLSLVGPTYDPSLTMASK